MKLNSIQFLRALAVILVVYAHAIDLQMLFSVSSQQNFLFLKDFGAVGVDIFFAISGFIISYVANKYMGIKEGFTFLKKRFLRINPIYYITSLIYLVVLAPLYGQLTQSGNIRSLLDTFVMIPVLNIQTTIDPILSVGWSLSFEWWFYLLFYLLILFKVRKKALLLLCIIPLSIGAKYIFHFLDFRLLFITNPIMLEFLFGVVTYWLYTHVKIPGWIAFLLILLGIAGYGYNIMYGYGNISEQFDVISSEVSMHRVVLWGIPSACIVAGCIFLEQNGIWQPLWNNRLIVLTGDASYSIYLVHRTAFFLLSFFYHITGFFLNPDVAIFIQTLIAIVVGIAFYKTVEKPLLQYIHTKRLK
jgi:peptidoglycan/LPS O-acetylase OafA/YrhL